MGEALDRVAENLKNGVSPKADTVEMAQLRVHHFDGMRAINMANVTSRAGNRTALWSVIKDGEYFFRITTIFADGTKVYKDMKQPEFHRMLISQTRRTKKEG